jgi:hypothetical protein
MKGRYIGICIMIFAMGFMFHGALVFDSPLGNSENALFNLGLSMTTAGACVYVGASLASRR